MKTFNPINNDYISPVNLEILANTYNTLETGHKEAVAQASKIKQDLAILDLNAAEDEWRANKINEVETILNNNTIHDNAIGAIDNLVAASSDILFGADTMGRIKANQAWKANNAKIDAMAIPEDYKQTFKEWNPYEYNDKYDENGNIIGGTEWKPKYEPVQTVDLAKLITQAIQIAAKEQGGGSQIQYLDKNGQVTPDLSKAFDGNIYNTVTRTWERLPKEKILAALDGLVKSTAGAEASLKQDFEVAKYQHEKAVAENGGKPVISSITDDQGVELSEQAFFNKRVMGAVEAASYYNSVTKMDPGTGAATYHAAKAAAGQAAYDYQQQVINSTIHGRGPLIQYDIDPTNTDRPANIDIAGNYANARNSLFDTYKSITGKQLYIPEGKRISVEELIRKREINNEDAITLHNLVNVYNSAVQAQENYYKALPATERSQAMFLDRFFSGQGLLAKENGGTKMDDYFIKATNDFWNSGNGTASIAEFHLSPKTRPIFENYLNNGDPNRLKELGINIDSNGVVTIHKGENDGIIPLLSNAILYAEEQANKGVFSTIYSSNANNKRYNVILKDNKGNNVTEINYNQSDVYRYKQNKTNSAFNKIGKLYNKAIELKNKLGEEFSVNPSTVTVNTLNWSGNNFTEDYFQNLARRGLMTYEVAKKEQDYANSSFENAVINGDYSGATIFAPKGKFEDNKFSVDSKADNISRIVDPKTNLQISSIIKAAYADKRVKWTPTPITGMKNPDGTPMYGYNITILPKENNKGEIVSEGFTVTVGNIASEDAANMLMKDPAFRISQDIVIAGATKGDVILSTSNDTPYLGNNIIVGQGDNYFTTSFKNIPLELTKDGAANYGVAINNIVAVKNHVLNNPANATSPTLNFTEEDLSTLEKSVNTIAAYTGLTPEQVLETIMTDIQNGYR